MRVASLSDLPVGSMKHVRVGDHRVLLVRTSDGVSALDHACPHQGYGLTQGYLDAEAGLVTCAWHNWKFRVDDGRCVLGEEDVRTHDVRIDGDDVHVEVHLPSAAQERERLLPSLRRGIKHQYNGQIARDVVRLLRADASPAELVWEGIAYGAPRGEFGWGHSLAVAADALEVLADYDGDERAFPIVNALAGVAETERRRPLRSQPAPVASLPADPEATFRQLVEAEDVDGAEALLLGALDAGMTAEQLRPWILGAVSEHHLSFGHMAIYTQKAYSLLDQLGHDRAATILPHLVPAIVWSTREDTLPYFRAATREVLALDPSALAAAPDRRSTGWVDDDGALRAAILEANGPVPVEAAARAVRDGAGVEGLLDTVALAISERLLRYDPAEELAPTDFGWLDMTHVLTYADAARWAWRAEPGPDTARLALWTVLMAHDSGRAEKRRPWTAVTPALEPKQGDLRAAVEAGAAEEAAALALGLDAEDAGRQLERAALSDLAGSFIVSAHLVKTAHAARREAAEVGSNLPLAAAARFCASPRVERFVGSSTAEAIHLAQRGTPLER